MILLPHSRAWQEQPQDVDARPSELALSAGLHSLTTFADGVGTTAHGTLRWSRVGTAHIRQVTADGVGVGNVSSGNYWSGQAGQRAVCADTRFAVLLAFQLRSTGQANKYAAFERHDAGVGAQTAVLYGYTANQFEFFSTAYSGTDPRTGSGITVADTQPHVLIYTYDGATWSGVLDGRVIFSVARSFSITLNNATGVTSLLDAVGVNTLDACILHHATFARGLSPDVAATLSAPSSRWQLFAPRRIWGPVSAGGGGTSLIADDVSHAHAADSLILTTSTALVIADASHAHAADSIALSTLTQLALDDALHGHTADAPTLSTQSLLAVDDAAHAHGAEAMVLGITGATTLTVADATHAHAVDGIVLSAQSVLAIQDALHAHAADSITLDASGAAVLLLADALHAHTADGLALTVDAWLVVADAGHAHRVDAVVLTLPGADPPVAARYTITARARRLVIEARARRLEAVK